MDRRSWLWRRKSSEKSPGETESSGSVSSLSERFSDDQALPNHSCQSPEVTSKNILADEEVNDNMKALTQKLSDALLDISAKEELVKQHAKVAEEAVSGWEKAEKEVSTLKQQLDAAVQNNSALEDRVSHLDGALKECVRQLRQAREEKGQNINVSVAKRARELEATNSELETQLADLQKQLQTAKTEAAASAYLNLHSKLEAAEKENSALKLELLSRVEELEFRILERDLSSQAAETASKQHLESTKKVAKLEAECLRLKAVARKASPNSDHNSSAPSFHFVYITDNQSDSGETVLAVEHDVYKTKTLDGSQNKSSPSGSWASDPVIEVDQFKNGQILERTITVPPVEINLMDDFLEMEKLAASADTKMESYCVDVRKLSHHPGADHSAIKAELEAMAHRTTVLAKRLEKIEAEKLELEMALEKSKYQLETSNIQLKEAELKLVELQNQLAFANKSKYDVEVELRAVNAAKAVSDSRLEVVEAEMETQLAIANKSMQAMEERVKSAIVAKEVAESRLRGAELGMKMWHSKVASLEEEVKIMRTSKEEVESRYKIVGAETETQLILANKLKRTLEEELKAANETKEMTESQLKVAEAELKSLRSKVVSLEEEVEKERGISDDNFAKLLKMKQEMNFQSEANLQHLPKANGEWKMQQDKELAVAASNFADCQKTMASLSQKLRSLATLEDFLIDSEKPLEINLEGVVCDKIVGKPLDLGSS